MVAGDTSHPLSHFRVVMYRLTLTARDTLHLPPYKGSTLRGGFGTMFRRVCCTMRERECKRCTLHPTCPYGYIFETAPPPGSEKLRVLDNIPRPFVLEPPLEAKTEYAPGETMEFGLVLVGRAVEFFPYFVVTFRELGELGIGRGRGRYRLSKIQAVHPWRGEQEEVFHGDSAMVKNSRLLVTAEDLRLQVERLQGARSLSLQLITMARLKYEDDLTDRLEFHVLVRALLRRLSTLSYFHHGVPLELDFRGLIGQAEGIRLVRHQTRWVDWERYSRRQDRRMTLGGLVGEVTYEAEEEGNFDVYLPLLLWGELVHVGKNATFGLGQYRIDRARTKGKAAGHSCGKGSGIVAAEKT